MADKTHFSQTQRRRAEFFKMPNILKKKVGDGGLAEEILEKAEQLLANHSVDFAPLGEMYLVALSKGIELAKSARGDDDNEYIISSMIYPAMQLKANGGMFHYELVTKIADKLIQFLEVIEYPDIDAVEIVLAFHTTIRAIVMGRIQGPGGRYGEELLQALNAACMRYFEKYPAKSKI
jgi:hypothetical protein